MRRASQDQPVSDINITPLTDVMLVLLVIFMISSPILMAHGIEVHLPQVENPPALVQQDHVLYVSTDGKLDLDGTLYASSRELSDAFVSLVSTADEKGESVNLFVRADTNVTYGAITDVMDLATSAGIEKISLVQEFLTPTTPDAVPE